MSVEFLRADWPAPPGVVAGTTLRGGGSSSGAYASLNLGAHVGDRADCVAENLSRLQRELQLPRRPAWLRQVHGRRVVDTPRSADPEADASVTAEAHFVCAVLTADCLPVLFTSRDGSAVAAAHAGWRGLLAGVLEATVAELSCEPASVFAWLGPAISQPAFEVGDEVRQRFVARAPGAARHFAGNARGRWQCDLYGLARQRLHAAGVVEIYGGTRCTHSEPDAFFSHRREGPCGRMASLIYRGTSA